MATLAQPALAPSVVSARSRRLHTAVVLGLALATRALTVGYVLLHFPKGWFFTRGLEMPLLAKSLLAGQGLSSPFGPPTGPSAMIAPAYPIFMAGVFHPFGSGTQAAALVVMTVHILLNLLTVWLILRVGRQVAGESSAVVAATVWACSPPVFEMPVILWETSFSTCFLMAAVAWGVHLWLHASASRSLRMWAVAGAGVAVAGLFNPALLPSLGLLGGWVALTTCGRRLAGPVLGAVVFVAVFSPWPMRNARVFHAFIPTRTTVGFELWMGNRPGATGYLEESLFPLFNAAELAEYKSLGEVRYFDHKGELAKSYVRTHPAASLRITAVRVARFWSGSGTHDGPGIFVVHALVTTLAGGVGLVMLWRSRRRGLVTVFVVPLVVFQLPYILTHAEFRYRLVLDPLLCVLGACLLERFADAPKTEAACHPV